MNRNFWNEEYSKASHLTLSDEPSEDLATFVRWALRNSEWPPFPEHGLVIDLGCGNGRNIIAMCKEANMRGIGIDISSVALSQAKLASKSLDIKFIEQSISKPIPVEDQSVDVVLDMMTSHFLNESERTAYVEELARITKPFAWVFFKTFVFEGDMHIKRLLQDYPAGEENSYIHPKIKVLEHVFTEEEIYALFSPYFKIYKMLKSYKHVTTDGKPYKRRTISVYMERKRD